ncbi:hypothetical protein [Roseomonas chloroacetimidivorans]|jgi:hypothetical protein|uniref:hypothetical protein n=1 Tax=Roseomonas chloroacetimidivorans TaxID=1766656 RepID=UPI003C731C76
MRRIAPLLVLAVMGCTPVRQEPVPPVPPLAGQGTRNPAFNAIEGAAEAFSGPARLAGRPADAAVAVSRLEWATLAVAADRSFFTFSTITPPSLQAARWEVRRALGIPTDVPGTVVINGMEAAAAALARGDTAAAAAALPPPIFPPDILTRLANLPRMPQANQATRRAQRDIEFGRIEDQDLE